MNRSARVVSAALAAMLAFLPGCQSPETLGGSPNATDAYEDADPGQGGTQADGGNDVKDLGLGVDEDITGCWEPADGSNIDCYMSLANGRGRSKMFGLTCDVRYDPKTKWICFVVDGKEGQQSTYALGDDGGLVILDADDTDGDQTILLRKSDQQTFDAAETDDVEDVSVVGGKPDDATDESIKDEGANG